MSLSEIIQTVTLGRKTGRLVLRRGRRRGRIWFERGKVRHAEAGKLSGEEAFVAMVGWSTGSFVLTDGKLTEARTLDKDAMLLVMEGLRRLDEASLNETAIERTTGNASLRLAAGSAVLVAALAILLVVDIGLARRILARSDAGSTAAQTVAAADGSGRFGRAFGAPTWDAQFRTVADVADDQTTFAIDALDPEVYRHVMKAEFDQEESAAPIVPALEPVPEPDLAQVVAIPDDEPLWLTSLPAMEEGFLAIMGQSRVGAGTLTILVNDEVVYNHDLVSTNKKTKRFFRKLAGKVEQTFEATIPMEGGTHEVVAQLHVEGKPERYENRLTVEVEPGVTRSLSLFAGRSSGRYLSLTLD